MQGFEIAVTLKGESIQDVLAQAQALIDADGAAAVATVTTGKRGGKKTAAAVEDDLMELGEEGDGGGGEELSLDEGEELGEELEEPPAKTTKKKLTEKDVNAAAMAYAKKHGRPKTFAILKKHFKVASILELKPEQFAKAIATLKV